MPEPAFTLPGIRVHLPRNRCSRSPESVFTMLWNGCSPSAGICVHDAPEYAGQQFVPFQGPLESVMRLGSTSSTITTRGIIKARRICCCSQPATSYLSPSARCAPGNGLADCYVSTIGKPHEYFDLTSIRISGVWPNSCLTKTGQKAPSLCTLRGKYAGARSAGKPHAACDVAGAGNGLTVRLVRHSHRKRGETDRPRLRSTAPTLDPTGSLDRKKITQAFRRLGSRRSTTVARSRLSR